MSYVKSGASWLRQTFAWSNSWSSWQERLISVAFFVVALGLVYLTLMHLAFWQAIILWAVYAVALAIGSQQGWIKLFGPVLFYDMVRTARRSRYSIIRILYGALLVIILCYMFLILFLTTQQQLHPPRREMAVLAEMFFATFMLLQLGMVILLTPAYVAGCIAEEKDRKTLEFLLATDLASAEIVLSKFLSRLANMTLLLLTGVPILSILQFIGGVDPQLMLAGFAAIGLTLLGIGSISLLLSTLFKKPRDAISLTYLLLITYAGLSSFALAMQTANHAVMHIPIWFGDSAWMLKDVSIALNAGNPIAAIIDVSLAITGRGRMGARTDLAAELPGIISRYAWFHLTLSLVCVIWSIVRLRDIALKQTVGGTTIKLRWWQRYRPSPGDFPMIWKEILIEGGMKVNWLIWVAVAILVLLTLGIGFWVLGHHLWIYFFEPQRFGWRRDIWESLGESMNIWFRVAGTSVACLLLLMLGVRASTSITSERERNTFDALLTTPMSAESILMAKLVGNLMSMRLGALWLGSMLVLVLVTGGLHVVALPLIITAWCVYALVCTMIGLGYSILCKSSMHAAVFTVLTTLALGGGHWLITSCCCMPTFGLLMMPVERQNRDLIQLMQKLGEYFVKFQAGVTPPFVFGWGSFSWRDFDHRWQNSEHMELLIFSVLGLFLWMGACVILWFGVLLPAFRRIARRIELIYR